MSADDAGVRQPWSAEEDEALRALVQQDGTGDWVQKAETLGERFGHTRSESAMRVRWKKLEMDGRSTTRQLAVGDHVQAVWGGDGRWYAAVVAGVSPGSVTVDWKDGSDTYRKVATEKVRLDAEASGDPASPSELDPDHYDRLHIVEAIVDRRTRGQSRSGKKVVAKGRERQEYRVRWKGYSAEFDTWEGAANLDAALIGKAPTRPCISCPSPAMFTCRTEMARAVSTAEFNANHHRGLRSDATAKPMPKLSELPQRMQRIHDFQAHYTDVAPLERVAHTKMLSEQWVLYKKQDPHWIERAQTDPEYARKAVAEGIISAEDAGALSLEYTGTGKPWSREENALLKQMVKEDGQGVFLRNWPDKAKRLGTDRNPKEVEKQARHLDTTSALVDLIIAHAAATIPAEEAHPETLADLRAELEPLGIKDLKKRAKEAGVNDLDIERAQNKLDGGYWGGASLEPRIPKAPAPMILDKPAPRVKLEWSAEELAVLAEVDPDTQPDWESIAKRLGTEKTWGQLSDKWKRLRYEKSLRQCQVCGTKPAEMALLGECIRRWCPGCAKVHAPDAKRGGCFPQKRVWPKFPFAQPAY